MHDFPFVQKDFGEGTSDYTLPVINSNEITAKHHVLSLKSRDSHYFQNNICFNLLLFSNGRIYIFFKVIKK